MEKDGMNEATAAEAKNLLRDSVMVSSFEKEGENEIPIKTTAREYHELPFGSTRNSIRREL